MIKYSATHIMGRGFFCVKELRILDLNLICKIDIIVQP